MEGSTAVEVIVLNSLTNLLTEAVRWTSKKRFSLHKILVQEESNVAETKSLSDLIQDLHTGHQWTLNMSEGSENTDNYQEEREKRITTLKYISQMSDKLLQCCTKENFSISSQDFSDLEEKKGHVIPKRVKQELLQEEEPLLSNDLVEFLNELEENENDNDEDNRVTVDEHFTSNENANIKVELAENVKENTTLPAKKIKKKGSKKMKGSRKLAPKKENAFTKYMCFECDDTPDLGDKKSFKAHWEALHVSDAGTSEPKIRCRVCQKDFMVDNNAQFLQQGEQSEVQPKLKITWDVICQYLLHLVVNHEIKMPEWVHSYKCDATGCKFVALDELSLEFHHKLMKYDCAQCGMHFSKKQRRTSHIMSKHSDRAPEGRSKKLNYTHYKCYLCTMVKENSNSCEVFPDTDSLTDHVKEVHTGKTEFKGEMREYLQCTVCLKNIILEPRKANNYMISRGLAALLHHMVSIHNVPIPPFIEPLKCTGCSRLFVHMEALLAHSRTHVDKVTGLAKRSQCYKCGKFIKVSAMHCHLRICQIPLEKRASFTCPVCNEIFLTRSGMTRHLKATHTGENNFLCHLCTNVYKSKYALQYHMHRAHQFRVPGAEVYYCQVQSCSYSSILASDVKKHEMRVHNIGEPPAECNICGKKVKKRYLKKHQSLHNKPLKQIPPSLPKQVTAGLAEVMDLVPICANDVPTSGEIEIESHPSHQHHNQHLQQMAHHQVSQPQQQQQQMQHAQSLGQQIHGQVDPTGTLGRIGLQVVYNHYMN